MCRQWKATTRRGRRRIRVAALACCLGTALPVSPQVVVSSEARAIESEAGVEVRDGEILLALDEAIAISLRRNLGLQVQRYQREQAHELIRQNLGVFDLQMSLDTNSFEETQPAASALEGATIRQAEGQNADLRFDQLISSGGVFSFDWANARSETNSVFSAVNPSYNVDVDLLFSQPLLRDFGSTATKRGILISRNNSNIGFEILEQQVIATVDRVEGAYWDLVEAQEQLAVALESLELAQELHEMNRIQVEVGTLAPLELVQSEVGVATREEEVLRADVAAEDAADRLRQLLNIKSEELWTTPIRPTTDPLVARIDIDLGEAISIALRERSEIREQRLRIDNLATDARFFRQRVRPRLDLQLRYGYNGLGGNVQIGGDPFDPDAPPPEIISGGYSDALDQVLDAEFDGWSTGFVFGYPIQNRRARADRTIAELALIEGETVLEDLRLAVLTEVRQAARAVETAAEAIDLATKSTELAERNLDAEQKRYENGLSTSFQVLEIQEDLTEARSREVTAIAGYRRALVLFYSALGRLLEEKGIELVDEVRQDGKLQEPLQEP